MLNSLTLLRAMNGIYEEDVVMAGNSYFDEKQVKHLKTKRIISFALAAALILSLGIAAYVCYGLLALLPAAIEISEALRWKYLTSAA